MHAMLRGAVVSFFLLIDREPQNSLGMLMTAIDVSSVLATYSILERYVGSGSTASAEEAETEADSPRPYNSSPCAGPPENEYARSHPGSICYSANLPNVRVQRTVLLDLDNKTWLAGAQEWRRRTGTHLRALHHDEICLSAYRFVEQEENKRHCAIWPKRARSLGNRLLVVASKSDTFEMSLTVVYRCLLTSHYIHGRTKGFQGHMV